MKKNLFVLTALASAVIIVGCRNNSTTTPDVGLLAANVLQDNNRLGFVNLLSPQGSYNALGAVTGLQAGDNLVAIDRRPQNGFLYGLGHNATAGSVTLYVIHPETLFATKVGDAGSFVDNGNNPVAIGNAGASFAIDFNPSVDRLRVINSLGQNFRMNPNNGALVDGDLGGAAGSVAGLNMDGGLNGSATTAQGTAYVSNVANTTTTTQYTLDAVSDRLFVQNPPNAGTLSLPVSLSPVIDTLLGFDIAPGVTAPGANLPVTSGNGHILVRTGGAGLVSAATVNLVSGAIGSLGTLSGATAPNGISDARSLAIQNPAALAVVGLSADGSQLLRFAADAPGTTVAATITGVTAGESLVGIDFRPANGQLIALGINPTADTGTLYRLDPQLGAATVLGTASSIAFRDGAGAAIDLPDPATAGYGFDFNPTVDRIRVTTSTGLNFRLNPDTGAAVDGNAGVANVNPDGNINGSTVTGVSGAAYTNSVASSGTPAAVTTLYVLDGASGTLSIQTNPNAGTLGTPIALTRAGAALTFTSVNGFDIPADVRVTTNNAAVTSGDGFAALTSGGVTQLYRINLVNGQATALGNIGTGAAALRGLAVGMRHAL